jgi:hypothetical protein
MQQRGFPRLTEAEWRTTLTQSYGAAKTVALIAEMKKVHPEGKMRRIPLTQQRKPHATNFTNLLHEIRGVFFQYFS